MPCYVAWYEYVTSGTSEFAEALQAVQGKLRAIMHVIDYYYAAAGLSLPDLPVGVPVNPFRHPRSPKEYGVREMICHHLACDGVDFMTLFDVASLLDERKTDQKAYLSVIRPCSMLMKQHQNKFVVAYNNMAGSDGAAAEKP